MDNKYHPTMLDYVKAMSDPDRLKVIGALTPGPRSAAQVAEAVGLTFRKTMNHLSFLEFLGIVRAHPAEKKQDALYELDATILERLARQQFEVQPAAEAPVPEVSEGRREDLGAYLNPDGSIRRIPNTRTQTEKFALLMDYLAGAFETGRTYSEREVNAILKRFHADVAGLRRDLVDMGRLARERDGSKYWRPG